MRKRKTERKDAKHAKDTGKKGIFVLKVHDLSVSRFWKVHNDFPQRSFVNDFSNGREETSAIDHSKNRILEDNFYKEGNFQ